MTIHDSETCTCQMCEFADEQERQDAQEHEWFTKSTDDEFQRRISSFPHFVQEIWWKNRREQQISDEAICNDVDQVLSDRTRDRRLKELLQRVAAFKDDPGHSDLDDQQPINLHLRLGDVHFARGVLSYRDRIPELVLRLPSEPFSEGNPYQTTDQMVKTPQKLNTAQARTIRESILDVLDQKLWRLHETQWYVFPGTKLEAEEKSNAERLDFVDEVILRLSQ